MIELLLLVGGIVALWKFSGAISAFATGTRVKAEVYAEDVVQDSIIDRVDQMEEFNSRLNGREIKSHDQIMSELKVD